MTRPEVRLLYAASERDADILYPTRFFAPDPFLFVQVGQRRLMVMSDLEMDRARAHADVDRVLSWSKVAKRLEREGERPVAAAVIAGVLGDLGVRRVVVPRSFDLGLAMDLDERGIRLELGPEPFWPERAIKAPAEIRAIESALRAAEAGLEAGDGKVCLAGFLQSGLRFEGCDGIATVPPARHRAARSRP